MDMIKLGRSGKNFYVFGAPEEWYGPHASGREAEKAYTYIIDNFKDFEVVNRKIRKKDK